MVDICILQCVSRICNQTTITFNSFETCGTSSAKILSINPQEVIDPFLLLVDGTSVRGYLLLRKSNAQLNSNVMVIHERHILGLIGDMAVLVPHHLAMNPAKLCFHDSNIRMRSPSSLAA